MQLFSQYLFSSHYNYQITNQLNKKQMKKVKLLLGIFCLALLSACCGNSGKEGACCQKGEKKCCASKSEMSEEQKAFFEEWQNFDNLPAERQKELLAKSKAYVEKSIAEKKACIEKCEAELANFDNLTIAEQKALLDQKMLCTGQGMCGKEKGKCPQKKGCAVADKEKTE